MSTCHDCYYRDLYLNTCDFYLITGVRRGCPADDNCTRYLARNGQKRRGEMNIPGGKGVQGPMHKAMLALYNEGLNDVAIAEKVGCCSATVRRWRGKNCLPGYFGRPKRVEADERA